MHRVILFLLVALVISGNVFAGNATVSWNANGESDLAGYKIYYGTSPRGTATRPNGYSQIATIPLANLTSPSSPSHTLTGLTDNVTYYFAVTAYDDKSPANESAYSTEVSKLIVPTNTATNVRFTPRIESPLAVTGRSFTVSLFNPGGSTLVGEFTANPDGTGNLVMPSALTIAAGTYDVRYSSPAYLRKRQANIAVNSNATIILPILVDGDVNNDNTINSLDWSLMSPLWNTSNTAADINKDGTVNSIDFSFMNKNWGTTGDN